jgi:hypothetical protein
MLHGIRPTDYGYVFYKDKPPGRPVRLMLMGAGPWAYHVIETDSSGYFQLPPSILIAPVTSHTLLSVVEPKNQDRYDLEVMNTYERVNRALPGIWYYPAGLLPKENDAAGEALPDDKEFNSIKTLKTIVIHGEDNEQYYAGNATCNDYVCPFGVLNCPNHPYGRRPVIGETYLYFDYAGGPARQMYYAGCVSPKTVAPFLNEVRTIHLAPGFYKPDGKGSNAPGL